VVQGMEVLLKLEKVEGIQCINLVEMGYSLPTKAGERVEGKAWRGIFSVSSPLYLVDLFGNRAFGLEGEAIELEVFCEELEDHLLAIDFAVILDSKESQEEIEGEVFVKSENGKYSFEADLLPEPLLFALNHSRR